jgi:2,5-dihydroxypyridine 5,6-dioxygenase
MLAFPAASSVDGKLVLAPATSTSPSNAIAGCDRADGRRDYVTDIDGEGADVDMMRGYFAAWGDHEAYGVSHVGWGMNPKARWDAMAFYDRRDFNGTELRAFAGNFLYSTGANEVAGRHTLGHFDLPLRNCSIALDAEDRRRRRQAAGELA